MIFRLKRTRLKKTLYNELYFEAVKNTLEDLKDETFLLENKKVRIHKITSNSNQVCVGYYLVDNKTIKQQICFKSFKEFENLFKMVSNDK